MPSRKGKERMRAARFLDEYSPRSEPKRTHPYVKLAGLARGLRIAEEDLTLVDPWDPTGVEERLRAEKPTRGDLLVAASLFRSIRLLVNATQKQRNAIATALLALPRPHDAPPMVPEGETH